jgi:transcriptional regulator with XRE-family HTH domain
MSTTLLKDSFNTLNIQCSKSFFVSIGRPKLAELVRCRAVEMNNLSTNEIARRAKAAGYELSNGTVWNVMNNRVKDVKEDTLEAIGHVLNISKDEMLAAYYDKPLSEAEAFDSEIGVLFKGFDELSDKDKAEMLATVKMLGSEIQRRRPKKPPDKSRPKGKK